MDNFNPESMAINIKITLTRPGAALPEYATEGAAALDLRSADPAPIIIAPGTAELIPTGIAVDTSGGSGGKNAAAVICARSGLAHKYGIHLSNGIGLIDSDYRGEIFVSLRNGGTADFTVNFGDRIAQLMFIPVYAANLIECAGLDETQRDSGGFGSTGKK